MQRRTLDLMISGAGVMLAIVLIVFGVYFNGRYAFAQNNVHDQLTQQNVFFPEKSALTPEELQQPGLVKYAGQRLDDGDKAQVYANEYIGLHLEGIADGATYAELGGPQFALQDEIAAAEASNDPALPELQAQLDELRGQRTSLFTGETLRGLLLTTYGFWQFGQEAQLAAYASFGAAGILLLLVAFGVVHAVRTRRSDALTPVEVNAPDAREERAPALVN